MGLINFIKLDEQQTVVDVYSLTSGCRTRLKLGWHACRLIKFPREEW